MAAVPGLVACGFLMGRIGRINMLCGGLFTAMIFALFLPLTLTAEAALLAILCLFSGRDNFSSKMKILNYVNSICEQSFDFFIKISIFD